MFDIDDTDEPYLPTPEQLKYKIIVKNKKILVDVPVGISSPRYVAMFASGFLIGTLQRQLFAMICT